MVSAIEDYAFIGDLQSGALVGRDGSIDWLCLPRFDSPAVFAALLHDDSAGRWLLAPAGGGPATRRRYRDDTLVLETEWHTAGGSVRVVDCMPLRGEAADVVRLVEGLSGRVAMRMDLRLRPDYGRIVPWVYRAGGGLRGVAGPDAFWLHTPVEVYGENMTTRAEFTVTAGQRVPFVLTYKPSHLVSRARPVDVPPAIEATERFWRTWTNRCGYRGRWEEAVRRSLITLKGLTYQPTGGILAAATTSLPEQLGGPRNWDYRYCWLRDATFTLQALLGTGYLEEATRWRDWLLRAVAGNPADLQIMYGLDGTWRLPEYELDWLSGYEGSSPVRVGNAATRQFQLDVWGEVLESLYVGREAGMTASETAWRMQRALLDFLEGNWREPDLSLWEIRGEPRHFVHSKVMAWAGVDRAVRSVLHHGCRGSAEHWAGLRDRIHEDVCRRGFDAARNTFTQFYGSKGVDAALLLLPRVGFLPWDDPRVRGTVDTVCRELSEDGFLRRYRPEADGGVDGLPGSEATFLVCTFWLADALHGTGRRRQARELYERLLGLRNDVGMLAEEYDPATGRHLGNTPQAFSMVGLVNSALWLSGTADITAVDGRHVGVRAGTGTTAATTTAGTPAPAGHRGPLRR